MNVYENTYVMEPNVQRFTVAKICNSVVPQLYKGLFYENPPLVLRPRPGTSQTVVDAKTSLFAYLLDECNFRREVKYGLENKALFGTSIYKWGIEYVKIEEKTRKASQVAIKSGPTGAETTEFITQDEAPDVTVSERMVPRPFFEHRMLDTVLVDPKTNIGDIRAADFVVDVRYMDYYQLKELKDGNVDDKGKALTGWTWPEDLMSLWMPTSNVNNTPTLGTTKATYVQGIIHHAQDVEVQVSPDLLLKKMEILEYWDKRKKILVMDRKKVIFTGENPFKQIPFLSSNWWNRPKAFYGMGLGMIVGQNQRVDQASINAVLKILSFGINPIYLRKRDANAPTQMIRTGLGKILTVDGDPKEAYRLMETPQVPGQIWQALQESQSASESASGADQMLVQGSTAGPRSSMGRTAGGAAALQGASATRLDGPLDNFIDQVFEPFLYILHDLIFTYMSDMEIKKILGDQLGKDFLATVDMQEFHDGRMEYEVLAGASLAAKRTMAQSLTLITQIFQNPAIQENLADINSEYVDFKPILDMWMESSEWKNRQDIIKKMSPEMIAKREAKSQAAQAQSKGAQQAQTNDQKFKQKQALEDQAANNRIQRDITKEAFKTASMGEAVTGQPNTSPTGFGAEPDVE